MPPHDATGLGRDRPSVGRLVAPLVARLIEDAPALRLGVKLARPVRRSSTPGSSMPGGSRPAVA